jgi:hypothetical protein
VGYLGCFLAPVEYALTVNLSAWNRNNVSDTILQGSLLILIGVIIWYRGYKID